MDITVTFIGAILLGLGILLILGGIGIIRFRSYVEVQRGMGTAVAGAFFVIIGIVVLYFGFVPSSVADPTPDVVVAEQTPEIEPAMTNTPQPEPTETVTVIPTNTPAAEPSPTETVPPTPTETPTQAPTPEVATIIKLQTTATDVGIYAGPSDQNPRLGLLKYHEAIEVLGKVRGSDWYQIIAESGVTGWVNGDKVEFIAGFDEDVPITWPLTSTGSSGTTNTAANTTCMSVVTESDVTGSVYIKWSNLPDDTRWLYLTVRGLLNGEMTDLIQPNNRIDVNDRDTAENGFKLGSYLFDPDDPSSKGFPAGTVFSFTLQARDASSEALCAVSGTFSP